MTASCSALPTAVDEKIHALSLSELVSHCRSGQLTPPDVMRVYGQRTLLAQRESNCLTDILVDEVLSSPGLAHWGPAGESESDRTGNDHPLLGVPISVKGRAPIRHGAH